MKSSLTASSRKFAFLLEAGRSPLVLLTAATVLLFVALWWWLPAPFTLTLPIRTSRAVQLKLYYAGSDSGFREDRCTVRFADSRGAFKPIHLRIPTSNLRALRLHVSPGAVVDFGQTVLARLGKSDIAIQPSEISVANNSCKMEQQGSVTRFQTAADSDGFDLDLTSSQLPLSNARRLEMTVVILLCCLLALLVWVAAKPPVALISTQRRPLLSYRINARTSRRIVMGLTLVFVLATLFKLNGSSTPIWRFYVDGRLPEDGLLVGSVKDIRSDEWMVQTPWILSQAASDPSFPTSNPNVGDQATSLLVNLPIRHWTTIFRPQFWSFFVLDIEHAFAWYWNLKWYVVVVGGFLFFRSISRASAVATFAGTILVFFAPYIQWWYTTGAALPEMLGMIFIGLWAFRCVLRSNSALSIAGAAVLLLIAIENFIFCCYPRFQIPLLYFAGLVVVWLLMTSGLRRSCRPLRCLSLLGLVVLVSWCAFVWFGEVAATLRMTSQLEYPGKVFSVGGDFSWPRFFVPFLELGMTEFHYPNGLVNACNAAGFILFLPFVAILLVTTRVGRRDLLVIFMLVFILAVGYFMTVGIPATLASYSGWSLVYATRGILPIGIASIVCLVRLLTWSSPRALLPSWVVVMSTALVTAGCWYCLSVVNQRYDGFASSAAVIATAAYLSATAVLFLANRRTIAVLLLLVPTVAATAFVNPVGRGLAGFDRSDTFHWLQSFTARDRTARWLVLGEDSRSSYFPYLIKATGGDVMGGIRNNPDMRVFGVLDPEKKHFAAWNRFAIVSYKRSKDGQIDVTLTSSVSYTVTLPFSPALLDRLGVRYILDVDLPPDKTAVPGFRIAAERDGTLLLVRELP
jgi:hypothetical protein